MRITIICNHCKEEQDLDVKSNDYEKYLHNNEPVQKCFPYLTPAEREMFKSKTCGKCWDKMFKSDENI